MGWEQARPSRPAYRPARKYVPAQWVGIRESRQARILACWAGYVLPLRSGGGGACRSGRGGAGSAIGVARARGVVWDTSGAAYGMHRGGAWPG